HHQRVDGRGRGVEEVRPDEQQLLPLERLVLARGPHLADDAAEDHRRPSPEPRRPGSSSTPSTMATITSLVGAATPTVRSRTRLPCATSTRSPGPAPSRSSATSDGAPPGAD